MADDSELDHIRTFLGKVHTAATVKHLSEIKNIDEIVDASFQRMLVYPPEIMGSSSTWIRKRYKVAISETSEANLTTAINNVQNGCLKANRRETITAWTKPSTWAYVEIVGSNQAFENSQTKRWYQLIFLEVIWSIS